MNVLFICNQNKHRSKTAEELFRGKFPARSAGLYNEKPVRATDIDWADTIFVMEEDQRYILLKRFPEQCARKRLISLDIPDGYSYNQPELIELLQHKVTELL